VPILGALALLAAPMSARAAFIMQVSEPGSGLAPLTITDNGTGDGSPEVGKITWSGPYGDFTIDSVAVGTSNRTTPTTPPAPGVAQLQITSLVVRNLANLQRTLNILLGDTDFTFPGSAGSQMTLRSSIGGTFLVALGGDTFTFQSYADTSNAQFGTGVTSGQQTFTFSGVDTQRSFSGDANATFTSSGTYSLTNSNTYVVSPGGQVNTSGTTSVTAVVAAVPEPASLALGAAGFLLVGLRGWRARKNRA